MTAPFRLTLEAPVKGQDQFFVWSLLILPLLGEIAYIFDAWYFYAHISHVHSYQGLLSTIMIVFTYLRYAAPIESRTMLAAYYILLSTFHQIGNVANILVNIEFEDKFNVGIYFGWIVLELCMTAALIYYRSYRSCRPTFHLECKNLFSFISRLEVILALFIPFFVHNMSTSLTKHSIAFFLLFDFFSEYYSRFQGVWIKTFLYTFVITVTVCVASEWIYTVEKKHCYEIVSASFELLSAFLCDSLIIFQFIPYHFRPTTIADIARQGIIFQKAKHSICEPIQIAAEPIETKDKLNTSDECIFEIRL